MSGWTAEQLERIEVAQELEIAPVQADGTLRKPVPIWVVRAGDDLYVRAAYGDRSGWHGAARASTAARIRAGGVEQDVAVEPAEGSINDEIDTAYRSKYGRYASIVDSITDEEHRASTLRLIPRAAGDGT